MFTFPVSRDRREEDLSLKGNFKGWQGLGRVSNWWRKSGKLLKGLFLHHFHLFLVPERRYRTELSPDGQWRDSQRMWVTEGNVMFTSRSLSLRSFSTIKISDRVPAVMRDEGNGQAADVRWTRSVVRIFLHPGWVSVTRQVPTIPTGLSFHLAL